MTKGLFFYGRCLYKRYGLTKAYFDASYCASNCKAR